MCSTYRNLPIGAFVIIAIFLFVHFPQSINEANRSLSIRKKLKHMDPIGTTLFLGAVCSLLLALQWGGQTYAWSSSMCIGLFVGFGAISVCFGLHQWHRADLALIPFRILRKRSIYMGAFVLFFLGMSSLTVSCLLICPKTYIQYTVIAKCSSGVDANTRSVCILSTNIFPISPRRVDDCKRRPLYRPCLSTNFWASSSRGHCLIVGLLRELSSSRIICKSNPLYGQASDLDRSRT